MLEEALKIPKWAVVLMFVAAPLGAGTVTTECRPDIPACNLNLDPSNVLLSPPPRKPKPLTTRWFNVEVSKPRCRRVNHGWDCAAGEMVELGLRSDGSVTWRKERL